MRVLVIEDDEAIRSVLDRGLQAEGFDVDLCGDGPSGIWKALEGGHAAIVLDLLLPGLSGYRVCEKLPRRRHHHTDPRAQRQVR